jgi:hypothetical protein
LDAESEAGEVPDVVGCPAGYVALGGGHAIEMGFMDPAFLPDGEYPSPPPGFISQLHLGPTSGQGEVAALLPPEYTLYQGTTFAYQRLGQYPDGSWFPSEGVVVSRLSAQLGLILHVGKGLGTSCPLPAGYTPFDRLETGQFELATYPPTDSVTSPRTSLEMLMDTGDGHLFPYLAVGGALAVSQRDNRTIDFQLDAQLTPASGSPPGDLAVSLRVVATLANEDDTPRKVSSELSHRLNRGRFRVVDWQGRDLSYGPSGPAGDGTWACQAVEGAGEMEYCVPRQSWYWLLGEDLPGLVRPFTSLFTIEGDSRTLFGNNTPGAWYYTTANLRWFEREYVELLYTASGLDPSAVDTMAVVVGVAQRGGVPLEDGFSSVLLVDPDGLTVAEGCHLLDDFRCSGQAADQAVPVFAILGIPPTSPERPYTLILKDRSGATVDEYTQKLAPVAGGVGLPHN